MGMTIEEKEDLIAMFREQIFPSQARHLKNVNYEGQGEQDMQEYLRDTTVLLELADKGLQAELIQADYEARLKADLKAILEDLRFQAEENIENIYEKDEDNILMLAQHNAFADCFAQYNSLIEERIDTLKGRK